MGNKMNKINMLQIWYYNTLSERGGFLAVVTCSPQMYPV